MSVKIKQNILSSTQVKRTLTSVRGNARITQIAGILFIQVQVEGILAICIQQIANVIRDLETTNTHSEFLKNKLHYKFPAAPGACRQKDVLKSNITGTFADCIEKRHVRIL